MFFSVRISDYSLSTVKAKFCMGFVYKLFPRNYIPLEHFGSAL